MKTAQKIETSIAILINLSARFALKLLIFMFTGIVFSIFVKCSGLSLPPYF